MNSAKRPVIGLNVDFVESDGEGIHRVRSPYVDGVYEAGGAPLLFPCVADEEVLRQCLERVDGLVLTGASDYPPELYGEGLAPETELCHARRSAADIALARMALESRVPVFAICGGLQLIWIATGGKLIQHLPTAEAHRKLPSGEMNSHEVRIEEKSILARIFEAVQIRTNSSHHQGADPGRLGQGLRIVARTEDGVVEGVEATDRRVLLFGVQWHPEREKDDDHRLRLFRAFVEDCRRRRDGVRYPERPTRFWALRRRMVEPAASGLKRTPLYETHVASGAKMIAFGGWEMPIEYRGILVEHEAVRRRAGLFDVSHMGQISFAGPEAEAFLRCLLPNDVARLEDGGMLYSMLCREDGGVLDDLIVTRLGPESYLAVVNGATAAKDWEWIQRHAGKFPGCRIENHGADYAMLSIQGPESPSALEPLVEGPLRPFRFFESAWMIVLGKQMLLSRSGYTGEQGFEILCRPDEVETLWGALRDGGGQPVGLGARDTLRLEMGYGLCGQDLDEQHTPLEAGLGWTVSLGEDRDFIGARALREQKARGVTRKLVGLALRTRGVPRAGQRVRQGGKEVGVVTSGTFSPTRRQGIALGYVGIEQSAPGTVLEIESRSRALAAEVVRLPFVPSRVKPDPSDAR
jgi:aminomethyltransferase